MNNNNNEEGRRRQDGTGDLRGSDEDDDGFCLGAPFDVTGAPGGVCLFSEHARAAVVQHQAHPNPLLPSITVAATSVSPSANGRVFAIAHEGYLNHTVHRPESLPNSRVYFSRIMAWLCGAGELSADSSDARKSIAVVGKGLPWLKKFITNLGLDTDSFNLVLWKALEDPVPDVNVIIWMGSRGSGDPCKFAGREASAGLVNFVRRGGGLFVSMCPWGFEQITGRAIKTENQQNHVLNAFGLAFTSEVVHGGEAVPLFAQLPIHDEGAFLGNVHEQLKRILANDSEIHPLNFPDVVIAVCKALSHIPLKECLDIQIHGQNPRKHHDEGSTSLFDEEISAFAQICQRFVTTYMRDEAASSEGQPPVQHIAQSNRIRLPAEQGASLLTEAELPVGTEGSLPPSRRVDTAKDNGKEEEEPPFPEHAHYKQCFTSNAGMDGGEARILHEEAQKLHNCIAMIQQTPGILAAGCRVFPNMKHDLSAIPVVKRAVLEIESTDQEWVSTGLYCIPGEPFTVTAVSPVRDDGGEEDERTANSWLIRVGCHRDTLWSLGKWERWPDITQTYRLHRSDEGSCSATICSPWGGPIFVEHVKRNSVDNVVLEVSGAGRMAHFRLESERLSNAEWIATFDSAPWLELESKHVIFTIPSIALRAHSQLNTVANLAASLAFWDRVMVNHNKLIGQAPRQRKERLVVDVQIAAGYMHSGYPVMAMLDQAFKPNDTAALLFDADALAKKGSWGLFHEFGHNIQDQRWTFPGTVEVTVNFFTLYSMDKIVGISPWEHPWLERHKGKAKQFLQREGKYNVPEPQRFRLWQNDPGLALCTFAKLQHIFGWDIFTSCFEKYKDHEREFQPKRLVHKMEGLMFFLSTSAGVSLVDYFCAWAWPVGCVTEGRAPLRDDEAFMELCDWSALPPLSDDLLASLLDISA